MIRETDTIAAIATATGNAGVGVIRLSGTTAKKIALALLGKNLHLKPRYAHWVNFLDAQQHILDNGLLLYFPAPASYTGEDIVELQGHGGAVVLNMLLRRVLELGARLARPGEFSERAFLNGKLDLAQAEAIADLITSSTEQAVRSAQKSMHGVFSEQVNELVDELTELRMFVEAAIDFVDEEINFLGDGVVESKIRTLSQKVQQIQHTAQQGRLLHDGMTVVLAGKPNAGKSSLLNALAGHEAAIVTEFAGTTRDVLRERIQLDGMPLHIIDTAGLRDTDNAVEKEGMRRAHLEMQKADCIVLLVDVREGEPDAQLLKSLPEQTQRIVVYNKIDLIGKLPKREQSEQGWQFYLSLKPLQGLHLLTDYLKEVMGYSAETEHVFIARRRHLDALAIAQQAIQNALMQLQTQLAGELVAEELKMAQNSLAEITGQFTPDDLLGRIFSSFCIGK